LEIPPMRKKSWRSLFFHIADRYIDDEPLTHLVLYLIQSNHVNLDIDLIFV